MNTYDQYADTPDAMIQTRLSKSAVSSLVASIVSVVCCLTGPVGAVIGVLGLLLGVIGLVRTGAETVRGRGLAVSGIVIGLLGIVAGVGVTIGAMWALSFQVDRVAEPIAAIDAGDITAARAMFDSDLNADVSDEQIRAFAAALRDEHGAYVGKPDSFMDLLRLYDQASPSMKGRGFSSDPMLPLRFDKGPGIVLMRWTKLGEQGRWVGDIGFLRKDGTEVWLSEIEP